MSGDDRERLEAATSSGADPIAGDDDQRALRESWQAFGRLMEASAAEAPAIDPHEVAFAVRRRLSMRRTSFWGAPALKIAAALLLGVFAGTAVWKYARPPVAAKDGSGLIQPKEVVKATVPPKETTDEPWNDDWEAVAVFVRWALFHFPTSDRFVPDEFQIVRANLDRFEAECSLESL